MPHYLRTRALLIVLVVGLMALGGSALAWHFGLLGSDARDPLLAVDEVGVKPAGELTGADYVWPGRQWRRGERW